MVRKLFASIGILASIGIVVGWASPATAQLRNPCPWVNDGDCDEPNGLNLCAPGTDTADCSNPESNFGNGSGFAGGGGGGTTPTTWAPWTGISDDPRTNATQPAGVTPLRVFGPAAALGTGLMTGAYDIYLARSSGWDQPRTTPTRHANVALGSDVTYVLDLNNVLQLNVTGQEQALIPTATGAWGMYPRPGPGRANVLVQNSSVTSWQWICILPANANFANCDNDDMSGRMIGGGPGTPTLPPHVPPGDGPQDSPYDGPPAALNTIRVRSGTYGGNCGAPRGNVTEHLAQQCDGQQRCTYVVDHTVIGDPVFGCPKDYVAEYTCADGQIRTARAEPEAGYQGLVTLECPSR